MYVIVPSSTSMHWANLAVLHGVCSVVKNLPLTKSVVVGDMIASGERKTKVQWNGSKRCTGPAQHRDQYMPAAKKANSDIQTRVVLRGDGGEPTSRKEFESETTQQLKPGTVKAKRVRVKVGGRRKSSRIRATKESESVGYTLYYDERIPPCLFFPGPGGNGRGGCIRRYHTPPKIFLGSKMMMGGVG